MMGLIHDVCLGMLVAGVVYEFVEWLSATLAQRELDEEWRGKR